MTITREERIERALFRGQCLTLDNPGYRHAVETLTRALLQDDADRGDLTAEALVTERQRATADVVAREAGVVAGLAEWGLLLEEHGLRVKFYKNDGDLLRPGETVLCVEGDRTKLLGLERVSLNLLQRMSGIASTARCLQERVRKSGSLARIVGTRKTPWGLLDKRALHLGNGGTHRLSLGEAILVKNNHLALLASREEEAVPLAIERAWRFRAQSAFIEVEVRSETAAREAARAFRRVQDGAAEEYPCLLMLDNMTPNQAGAAIAMLQREKLWNSVLVEASGGISEANVLAYAACGADAISIGALTHSARALDICQRIA